MSTTSDRDRIAKLEAALAEAQANSAKLQTTMQAEIQSLRKRAWDRRSSLPGKLNDRIIQAAIKQARKDGKRRSMTDGLGLTLCICNNPYRGLIVSWQFRWSETLSKGKYKPRGIGLGSLNATPLAEARKIAVQCRDWLKDGKDPKVERALAKHDPRKADLFRTVAQLADEYLRIKIKPKSAKYHKQTEQKLRDFVVRHIGAMPVQSITLKVVKDTLMKTAMAARFGTRIPAPRKSGATWSPCSTWPSPTDISSAPIRRDGKPASRKC
jgi:Arm DNA-binding domain